MTKEHRIGRYKVKRGKSFAPTPNAHFLKASDGARREVCSSHTTERSTQFPHAKRCPEKCQKGDITHTCKCAHKITISNLNSSEYTCLNFLIVFFPQLGHISVISGIYSLSPLACRSDWIPFTATEMGFYSDRCWEITLLPFARVHTCIRGIQRWRGTVGTVNTASRFGVCFSHLTGLQSQHDES